MIQILIFSFSSDFSQFKEEFPMKNALCRTHNRFIFLLFRPLGRDSRYVFRMMYFKLHWCIENFFAFGFFPHFWLFSSERKRGLVKMDLLAYDDRVTLLCIYPSLRLNLPDFFFLRLLVVSQHPGLRFFGTSSLLKPKICCSFEKIVHLLRTNFRRWAANL